MHAPLLEVLDASPDDLATWDVLADWLEERGDPRAELMRRTRDVEVPSAPDTRAAEHAWFGDVDVRDLGLVWRHGFVALAHVTPKHAGLLNHPAFRFLRELNVSGIPRVTLPERHQLRALRCDGVQQLPTLPPLELLALLNSPQVKVSGAKPSRSVVSSSRAPEVHTRTRWGPVNFRALPAEVRAVGDGFSDWGGSNRLMGSNIQSAHRRLDACGACGAADFAQIFDGYWKFRESEYAKSYTFREELWCRSCGVFTFLELHMED